MQSGQNSVEVNNQATEAPQHQALNPLPTHNPESVNPLAPPAGSVTAREILKGFKDADNPLDFIRSNYATREPVVDPASMIVAEEQKRGISPVEENSISKELGIEKEVVVQAPAEPASRIEDTKKEVAPSGEIAEPSSTESDTVIAEDQEGAEGDQEEPLDSKQINFRAMRKKLSETTKTLEEIAAQKKELEEKLQKVETGEELPEVIKEKDLKIAELEKYQQLHALKLSPAYKEKYVKPIAEVKQRLGEIAADYEIPSEVLAEALNITNRRDLNGFLAEHFDDIGALEVKELITKAQTIAEEAKAAEEIPSQALSQIEEEHKKLEEVRVAQSRQRIKETARDAWVDSLIQIRQEGKIKELISKETDTDYNKRVVEPILTAASSEYGKLVRMLAENGLTDLPKELAFALARTVHLAHASAVSIESRARAEAEAAELKTNMARTTKYLRPPIGSSSASPAPVTSKAPSSLSEAADMILNSVLSNRR